MKVTTLDNAEKIPGVNACKMFSSGKAELIHLLIGPGENLPLHINPFDVVFHVLKGNGMLTIEEESAELKAHDTAEVKAGVKRGWENTGNEALKLLVIKIF